MVVDVIFLSIEHTCEWLITSKGEVDGCLIDVGYAQYTLLKLLINLNAVRLAILI